MNINGLPCCTYGLSSPPHTLCYEFVVLAGESGGLTGQNTRDH